MTDESANREWRPYLHQPRQSHDVVVLHANAAVGDAAGEQAGGVCAVDPDIASARPVSEDARASTRFECDRAVERVVEVGELAADIELSAGCRPVGLPDADD